MKHLVDAPKPLEPNAKGLGLYDNVVPDQGAEKWPNAPVSAANYPYLAKYDPQPNGPPNIIGPRPDNFLHVKTEYGQRIAIPKNWVVYWEECTDGEGMLSLHIRKHDMENATELMIVKADYDYVTKEIGHRRY